jgi:hypothetical protein
MLFRACLVLIFTVSVASGQQDTKPFVIDSSKPYVYLKFDRVADRKPLSPEEASRGLWLRLVNNCRIPIIVAVFNPGTGDPGFGVLDEVIPIGPVKGLMSSGPRAQPHHEEVAKERPPEGYSSEVFSTTTIQPGNDLLFSVPLNHVSPSWHLQVKFQLDLPGSQHVSQPHTVLPFYWKDIPEKFREPQGVAGGTPLKR